MGTAARTTTTRSGRQADAMRDHGLDASDRAHEGKRILIFQVARHGAGPPVSPKGVRDDLEVVVGVRLALKKWPQRVLERHPNPKVGDARLDRTMIGKRCRGVRRSSARLGAQRILPNAGSMSTIRSTPEKHGSQPLGPKTSGSRVSVFSNRLTMTSKGVSGSIARTTSLSPSPLSLIYRGKQIVL